MNAMVKGGGEVCLMTYPTPPYDVPYIVFYTSGVNANKKRGWDKICGIDGESECVIKL